MAAVPALRGPGLERLTWAQICERYPREWVALVEVDWVDDLGLAFRSAIVAGHGPRRRDPLNQARPLRSRYPSMAHYFTGPPATADSRWKLPLVGGPAIVEQMEELDDLDQAREAARPHQPGDNGPSSCGVLSERLGWKQICERYPDTWVVLVDFDSPDEESGDFDTAAVAGHGPTRGSAREQARWLGDRYQERGYFFTGPIRGPRRAYVP